MTDPTEKLRAGKGLFAGYLRAKRKADLVEHLRNFAAVKDLLAPIEAKESEQKRKLYEAIREVAVPAIDQLEREDQLKREEAANRIIRLMPPPISIPDSLLSTHSFRGRMLRTTPKGRPRKDALADEAAKLRRLGISYAQISHRLNQEHGQGTATKESVRKLLNSRKPKSAHGAAPPPDKNPK